MEPDDLPDEVELEPESLLELVPELPDLALLLSLLSPELSDLLA